MRRRRKNVALLHGINLPICRRRSCLVIDIASEMLLEAGC